MQRFVLLIACLTRVTAPNQNYIDLSTTRPNLQSTLLNTISKHEMLQTIQPEVRSVPKPGPSKPRKNTKQVKGESPMLNYIFDSYATSNKHFHDKKGKQVWVGGNLNLSDEDKIIMIELHLLCFRFRAPSFEDDRQTDVTVLDADTGATVYLECRVSSLRDKMISWLRVLENDNLELLTLDLETHSPDPRYRVDLSGDNWRLELTNAKDLDSGIYCCHVSTHPPMLKRVKLVVHPPEIKLSKESFLETGETLSLKCSVLHLHPSNAPCLVWYRGNHSVPLDEIRGGVLIDTDQVSLTSQLQVASLKIEDAGNYTCALESPISMRATTRVHVLQGSSLAELQSGVKTTSAYSGLFIASMTLLLAPNLLGGDSIR